MDDKFERPTDDMCPGCNQDDYSTFIYTVDDYFCARCGEWFDTIRTRRETEWLRGEAWRHFRYEVAQKGGPLNIILYHTATRREAALKESLLAGFKRHGEKVDTAFVKGYAGPDPKYDLAVFVGVRRKSMRIYNGARSIGQCTLMLDKGYFKRDTYHRFSVDTPQPLYLLQMNESPQRLRSLGVQGASQLDRSADRDKVVYCGASDKYSVFHGLGPKDKPYPANFYSNDICMELMRILREAGYNMQVVYRPQPSWWMRLEDKLIPKGTVFSGPDQGLGSLLLSTHCLITHGSNAAVEAAVKGVPVITTAWQGACPIYDLVNTSLEQVLEPKVADQAKLEHRMAQMAWCQFNEEETRSGKAWAYVKQWVHPTERHPPKPTPQEHALPPVGVPGVPPQA